MKSILTLAICAFLFVCLFSSVRSNGYPRSSHLGWPFLYDWRYNPNHYWKPEVDDALYNSLFAPAIDTFLYNQQIEGLALQQSLTGGSVINDPVHNVVAATAIQLANPYLFSSLGTGPVGYGLGPWGW
mmetsp:Transcript_8322/g.30734  ORF Transcript_8322/g.30734 Transcript_8322/m.30734 type:complete len:128 (-) Transcript_8322:1975-2358(-)